MSAYKISLFINQHPWTSIGVVLVMLFGFQLFNIIFGFDIYDTGYHLVGYENIFSAPDSVIGNFGIYLTSLVGGTLMYAFPNMGVLGFRLTGALMVLLTIVVIFITLKNEIPVIHLLLGSILVIVGYVDLLYCLCNGILSCCLYAISIIFLYKGLSQRNQFLVLLGGIIVGLNIFTRLPNVLGVGIVFIILLHKKYICRNNTLDWSDSFLFMSGVGLGIIFVLAIMMKLGHAEIFKRSISALFSAAGGRGTHNIFFMFKIYFVFYLSTIIPLLVFYALIHIEKHVERKENMHITLVFFIVCVLSLTFYIYEISHVYVIIWGFFTLGCIVFILKNRDKYGVLALFALYMLVIEIYGSDWSENHGSLPALLAAPIASKQIIDRKKIVYVFTFILAVCWQVIRKGNFMDIGPIYLKTEQIDNAEAKGIFTSKEKADAINSTLLGIRPYVAIDDTMMCFPLAPMMNYLTHTRPAGGTCWIGEDGDFILPIERTPRILFNKTFFSGDNWYEIYKLDGKYGFDILSFIKRHRYRKVYENDYFMLFVPPVPVRNEI